MGTVRELLITYRERQVLDPGVGEPVRSVGAIGRLMSFLRFAADEEVYALILDAEQRLICVRQVSRGGRHETMIDAASLFRAALVVEGAAIILVHNHPNGGIRPSLADIRGTERVVMAGFALHVPLVDHVILGGKDEYSFAQSGMLRFIEAKALKLIGVEGIPEVTHPDERAQEAAAAIHKLGVKAATPMLAEMGACM
jgi:DNA repair protein RadC